MHEIFEDAVMVRTESAELLRLQNDVLELQFKINQLTHNLDKALSICERILKLLTR